MFEKYRRKHKVRVIIAREMKELYDICLEINKYIDRPDDGTASFLASEKDKQISKMNGMFTAIKELNILSQNEIESEIDMAGKIITGEIIKESESK